MKSVFDHGLYVNENASQFPGGGVRQAPGFGLHVGKDFAVSTATYQGAEPTTVGPAPWYVMRSMKLEQKHHTAHN